jgi:hypothetical protein
MLARSFRAIVRIVARHDPRQRALPGHRGAHPGGRAPATPRERNIFAMMEEDGRRNVEPDQPAPGAVLSNLDLLQSAGRTDVMQLPISVPTWGFGEPATER